MDQEPHQKRKAQAENGMMNQAEQNRLAKQARIEKQQSSASYILIQDLKKRWETLRIKHLPKAERRLLVTETLQLVKGHILDLIFKNDASRIVQSLIKYSETSTSNGPSDREMILQEMSSHFVQMSQTPYGRFVVLKAIKYAPNAMWRSQIVSEFAFAKQMQSSAQLSQLDQVPNAKIIKLLRHKLAAVVLDTIYCLYANSKERQCFVDAFYGSEYLLTKRSMLIMRSQSDKNEKIDLNAVLQKFPEKKEKIMEQFKDNIVSVVGKDGTLGTSELLHRVMYEYLAMCSLEQVQSLYQSGTSPLHSQLTQELPTVVHTKYGAQVAIALLNSATAKDRKVMLKSMKTFVLNIAQNEYGWMVIASIMESVDDTVLVKQAIWNELLIDTEKALQSKNVAKLYLYLLAGANTKYFSPSLMQIMNTHKQFCEVTSKKDRVVKQKAHLEIIVPKLVALLSDFNHLQFMKQCMFDPHGAHLVFELLVRLQKDSNEQYVKVRDNLLQLFKEDIVWPLVLNKPAGEKLEPEIDTDEEPEIDEDHTSFNDNQDLDSCIVNAPGADQKDGESEMAINQDYIDNEEKDTRDLLHVTLNPCSSRCLKRMCKQFGTEFTEALQKQVSHSDYFNRVMNASNNCASSDIFPLGPFFVMAELSMPAEQQKQISAIILGAKRNGKGVK